VRSKKANSSKEGDAKPQGLTPVNPRDAGQAAVLPKRLVCLLLLYRRRRIWRRTDMKISIGECTKAAAAAKTSADEKILPEKMPVRKKTAKPSANLTPLEHGMAVAQEALKNIPDIREDIVEELKKRIENGEYDVSGEEIAEMMMRRRAADRIR